MYQRNAEHDSSARAASDRRVGLFIDFDGIRRGLDDGADTQDLASHLRELAQEHGRILVASAYADWTSLRKEARDFRRQHIDPRIVLGREASDDPPSVVLSLDAQETLYLGPDLDLFVVATGDYAYPELLQRLRRADREILLVGLEGAAQGAAHRGASRFLPLEEVLGGRRTSPGPGPRRVPSGASAAPQAPPPSLQPAASAIAPHKIDFSMWDWAPFIRLLDELEANMPFVGFGWLLKKKLNPENSGCYSIQEKQDLMDRGVEEGILTLYKVDNIEEGGDPVTACRLNRDNPRVREFVG